VQEFLISGLRKLVEKTADDFDPALLSAITATQAIEEWARIEKIACAQKLRAADRAEDCGVDGDNAVAQSSGVKAGTARHQTKARRRAKPKTREALDKGKLSATQAAAIGEATEANPDAEESLLELAGRATTNELLDECERVKRAAVDDAELARRQRAARHLRTWTDALGMLRISGAFEPLIGATLLAEWERRADRQFREQSRAKGPIDTRDQRMADALASMLADLGGAATKKRGPRTVVRLIVHKDAAERGHVQGDERCETADGTQVPMAAVDDALLDDDTVVQEVEFEGTDVRSIKTMSKYIPQRLRDAAEAQGMRCVDCGSTKGLELDHVRERRDGGATSAENLKWRCRPCHVKKTARRTRLGRDPDLVDSG
jgi:hypothetical protein